MKRNIVIVVITLILIAYFGFKYTLQNAIYSSEADKNLAKLIESSISLIFENKVNDYSLNIEIPNADFVCYAGGVYSKSATTILNEVAPDYKYANLLEMKKQYRKGEGSSLLFIIGKDRVLPIFMQNNYNEQKSNYSYEFKISDELKPLEKMDLCHKNTKESIKIDIKSRKNDTLVTIK